MAFVVFHLKRKKYLSNKPAYCEDTRWVDDIKLAKAYRLKAHAKVAISNFCYWADDPKNYFEIQERKYRDESHTPNELKHLIARLVKAIPHSLRYDTEAYCEAEEIAREIGEVE